MFYKKRIETLETKILKLKNMIIMNANEHDNDIKILAESIETNTRLIEGHDKLLQQLIPTINKQTQKYKKLEENYQMLVKVVEKIVTKIDPEWKSKTVKINTKKGK